MGEYRTIKQLRREALGHDALLFSAAFTAGALVYFLGRVVREAIAEGGNSDFWSISLSDDLILSGLIAGELFLIWNNGLRQGLRGHSIGKHRVGLAVVDVGDGAPTGAARGILRGVDHGGPARSRRRRDPDRPAHGLPPADARELALRRRGIPRA